MSKKSKRVVCETVNYGLFAKWSNRCSELPKFLKFTKIIPARVEAEFGYTLNIVNGKGRSVDYTVYHPDFRDSSGAVEPTFIGSVPIRKSPFRVYIGDTLWEPISDKVGEWRFVAKIDGEVVEDMSFEIVNDTTLFSELIENNKDRHI